MPRDVGHLGHYVAGTCAATMSAMTTSPRSRLRYQSEWRGGSVKWRPRSRHESSARGRADRATTVGEQAQGLSLAPAHPMLRLCSPALRVAFGEDRSHALGPSHRPRNPLRMPLVLQEPPCGAYWHCCWSCGLSWALWPVSSATTTAGRTRTVPTLGPLRSRSLASHLDYVGLNAKIAHCSVPQPSK